MGFRLVSSGGNVSDVAVVNMSASGVVRNGMVVEFSRTGGVGVTPASASSTQTTIFGVCLDYAQGASDVQVKVIPFADGQIWEADCTDINTTAQVGLTHVLNAGATEIRNTATEATGTLGVFRAVAVTGLSTGSGKLRGFFVVNPAKVGQNQTTFN